jgi:hypothetical protein
MSTIKRNLHLFWRAERSLAESRLKLTSRKLTLAAGAGIAGLFALGMLNLAAFFALEQSLGQPGAAAVVGVINIVLAGLFLSIAQGIRPGEEEEMVKEVRDMAIGEIGGEIEGVQEKFAQIRGDIEGMRNSIGGFIKRPGDAISPAMIVSGLSAVSKLAKSGKK